MVARNCERDGTVCSPIVRRVSRELRVKDIDFDRHEIVVLKMVALIIALFVVQASSTAPKFGDYPAGEVFRGKPASPVLDTRAARLFRTELRRQAASGPNFAAHFMLARWGCGAGCVSTAIIDSRNGRVWFPDLRVEDAVVQGDIADHSTDFEIDSELIVARGSVNALGAGTAYFRWHQGVLSLIRFDKYRK